MSMFTLVLKKLLNVTCSIKLTKVLYDYYFYELVIYNFSSFKFHLFVKLRLFKLLFKLYDLSSLLF